MTQRDDAGEQPEQETDDDETESVSEEPAAKVEASASKGSRSRSARRQAKAEARAEKERAVASRATARAVVVGVVALLAGGAGGWFGHEAQAKAKLRSESAPSPAGSAGPCNDWQQKICASSGAESATCEQAKGASELLTPTTCESALTSVPATLAKVKAARASCDDLVGKLCKDLPQGSQACQLVKDKTPSLPADRCKEMLGHYEEVLNELRMLDQQGAMPGMGGPPGMPPGAMPPGAMPPQ